MSNKRQCYLKYLYFIKTVRIFINQTVLINTQLTLKIKKLITCLIFKIQQQKVDLMSHYII